MPSEFELVLLQFKRSLLTVCVIKEGHLEKLSVGGGGGRNSEIQIYIYFAEKNVMKKKKKSCAPSKWP